MYSCQCSCDRDFDSPEFFNKTSPKARQPYFCYECGEVIERGKRYRCEVGKWDGKIKTYRTCRTCAKIRDDMCGGCFVFGTLMEDLQDQWDGSLSETGFRAWMYENDEDWLDENVPEKEVGYGKICS